MSAERNLRRAVIRQAIRDLKTRNVKVRVDAEKYLKSQQFTSDLSASGYPSELRDSLEETVVASEVQRQYLCREILKHLSDMDVAEKENPPVVGGFQSHHTTDD